MKKLFFVITVSFSLLQAGESSWLELSKQVTWSSSKPEFCLKPKILAKTMCNSWCGYYDKQYGCGEFYLRALRDTKNYLMRHSLQLNNAPLAEHPEGNEIYKNLPVELGFSNEELGFNCTLAFGGTLLGGLLGLQYFIPEPSCNQACAAMLLSALCLSCPVLQSSHLAAVTINAEVPLKKDL